MNRVRPLASLIALLASTVVAGALNDDFIVAGQKAEAGEWPWQVRLLTDLTERKGFCGGSLIAPQWVLTAAHCLQDVARPVRAVGYGSTKRSELTAVSVAAVFEHPDYAGGAKPADVALLKLAEPLSGVTTVAMADVDSDRRLNVEGQPVTITGWGALIEGDPDPAMLALINEFQPEHIPEVVLDERIKVPEDLREVEVEIFNLAGCQDVYETETPFTVHDTEICAGRTGSGRDSCQGDSGGPLVTFTDDGWVQLGVVSWGWGCGRTFVPGVYARIASFRDWLDGTMSRN